MSGRALRLYGLVVLVGAAVITMPALEAQTPPAQTPQFRARTTVIPVDVRVINRDGEPVTNLKAEDFTVLENGKPQKVEYFSATELTPTAPDANPSVRLLTGQAGGDTLAPQNRRLFLIMFGRGRLQEPSKGLDATLRFVRQRLMPQDQVAIMAWNRATDFSTDHQRVAETIEKFKTHHEAIEALMQQHFGGLGGYYGRTGIPDHIQIMIDRVFGGPQGGTSREVVPAASLGRAEADARQNLDLLKRSELEAFRAFGGTDIRLSDLMTDPTLSHMTFDEYVSLSRQTMQDVGNLYAGIEYLRYIEGEKHIIFVTEQGFLMPRADHDRDLATMAADARVAIDTLQTGGVATVGIGAQIAVMNGPQLAALRTLSEWTGGQVSVSNMADKAYDRILATTGFGYLLGYTSSTPPNGRPRNIKVEVKRRGVSVSHRQAYVARSDNVRFDPRQSLATTRLVSAASHAGDIKDLRLGVKLTDGREGPDRFVDVQITIDGSRLVFARAGDQYIAAINIALIAGDYYGKNIGEAWSSKDFKIPSSLVDGIRKNGLVTTVRLPVRQPPNSVRVMVYDYGSDLLGSVYQRMR